MKKPQALVVYKKGQAVQLRQDQVDLIRRLCAKDANEDEFTVFMQVARTSRLDPFKKEIYCLIFNRDDPKKRSMVLITGIGGYRVMAARDHADYDGSSDGKFIFGDRKTPSHRKIPESCTMEIYAKGSSHPTVSTVYWDEFAPFDLNDERSKFWRNMPTNQLEKCCEAKGLRKRFPGLNNIYVDAELDRSVMEQTPGGRQFTRGGRRPDGSIPGYDQAKADQQKVLEEKLRDHGHIPGTERAQQAEASLKRVEKADEDLSKGKVIDVQPAQPKPRQRTKVADKPRGELMTGTIHNVYKTQKTGGAPYIDVKINNTYYKCWRTSIFDPLQKGIGYVIEFFAEKGAITGLKRIAQDYYEEDGKTRIPS